MDIARDTAVGGGAAAASAPSHDARTEPRTAESRASSGSDRSFRRSAQASGAASVRPSVSKFIREIRAAFGARFHLFELEAKRAAWSAAYMVAFGVGAALLGVTAWLILIAGLVYGAVVAGVPWFVAGVIAIALHAVAVYLLVRAIRAMVENLTFAATRRTLAESSTAHDDSGA